ncbi:hypothetical protein BC829DRAFT_398662, partial [Chytridium lagenaria]
MFVCVVIWMGEVSAAAVKICSFVSFFGWVKSQPLLFTCIRLYRSLDRQSVVRPSVKSMKASSLQGFFSQTRAVGRKV